ncbi:Hint domain-containing protein [Cognatiyoonia koreensis]|uniref:Hint domain-containing protein n=1 Tax=Cognatiyoonia koreensis TaxID=364200 RepID=A0A1I0N774_9RHOB|nr:Hint domain-containing protein [Cognatiyoonia koreensis]SEV96966.1 Hint domain-containing protein [Cognatiyoonia koreensis]
MFAFGNDTWDRMRAEEAPRRTDLTLADLTHGIVAGTKVATPTGWRCIEAIAPGDMVLTFDGGMQAVVSVQREVIWTDNVAANPATWPLHVPAGALGNREDMTILPYQAVLVESDAAENAFGDPFAMIPAAALEGFRRITRMAPAERIEIVTLQFAQDEVVFANIGALFFCPKSVDLLQAPAVNAAYQVLNIEQADAIVCLLEMEDGRTHAPVASAAA